MQEAQGNIICLCPCTLTHDTIHMKQLEIIKGKLTGGARAASRIELTPFSGDCRRNRSFKTINAIWEIHEGTSRMMLVSTAPGSTALQNQKDPKKKSDHEKKYC